MFTWLNDLWSNVRFADVLDVAFVATALYVCLSWLRREAVRPAAVAAAALAVVYVLARLLDMALTLMLFQAGLIVLLIALLIVFQQDVRRMFEQFAAWTFRRRQQPAETPAADTVVEAVAQLARERVGALIVLRGREPLDAHVRGGVPLGGEVSLPLLESIFHPATPGHDGAALVEGNVVRRFGVHLPLSANLAEVGRAGTRHAAAIGLAEKSDALVLVVSEERGEVSVAQGGRLSRALAPAEVRSRVEEFVRQTVDTSRRRSWRTVLLRGFGFKAAAAVLACLLWLVLVYRVETVQRTLEDVPVEFRNVPANLAVKANAAASVTVQGSQRDVRALNPQDLLISLDLSEAQEGVRSVPVTAEAVALPAGATVEFVDARPLRVTIGRREATGPD